MRLGTLLQEKIFVKYSYQKCCKYLHTEENIFQIHPPKKLNCHIQAKIVSLYPLPITFSITPKNALLVSKGDFLFLYWVQVVTVMGELGVTVSTSERGYYDCRSSNIIIDVHHWYRGSMSQSGCRCRTF